MKLPKPNQVVEVKNKNPDKLFIFSHPKVGKTSLVAGLPNHLLIDVEGGSKFVSGTKINVTEMAEKENISLLKALKEVANSIREANKEAGKKIYDYGIIDTATKLEEVAKDLAGILYKTTPMGKSWNGSDITTLPNGAGYNWLRLAYQRIYQDFEGLFNKCFIMLGHVKNASINKDGKDLAAKDINLTGKLKTIVAADADAIGFLYRKKGEPINILSFKTSENDLATGARPPHLRGKEFEISKLVDDNIVETYWEQIFIE